MCWTRRIPNGTYGVVRGRGLITPSYSIPQNRALELERNYAGAIWEASREPFSGAVLTSSWEPILEPPSMPTEQPHTASKYRNTRGSSQLEWAREERTTAGNRAGNSNGNSIGNHDGTTMIPTVYPRGFPNREPGGGWGLQGEGGGKWR